MVYFEYLVYNVVFVMWDCVNLKKFSVFLENFVWTICLGNFNKKNCVREKW